ncbi:MAG: MFS transporter [Candidatus Korarchaeota archaeon]
MVHTRKAKIAYSTASIASTLTYQSFGAFIAYFYERVIGLSVDLFAMSWAIYGVWNAINDPLAGFISDRTRTRWGRRIPYVLFGSIPLAITFALIWAPPNLTDQFLIFIYAALMMCLFDTCYTFVLLAWTALFPEMYPSKEERGEVSVYRQIFSIVGLILAFLLPPIIGAAYGWWLMGLILGSISAASMFVSLAGSREDVEQLKKQKELPFREAFIRTLKNRPFLHFVFGNLTIQYTFGLATVVLPLYSEIVLHLDQAMVGLPLLIIILIAMVSVPAWNLFFKRTDARRTWIIASLVLGLSLLPFFFLNTFAEVVIAAIPAGIGLGGVMFIIDPLIGETIDYDEYITGQRREGAHFGMNALIMRFSVVLSALTLGWVQSTTGFISGTPIQPESAVFGLRLLVAVFPLLGVIGTIISIALYPLKKDEVERIRAWREARLSQKSQLST